MFRSVGRVIRARPRTTVVVLVLAAALGTTGGVYGYALYQWRAARTALTEDRPAEARERLAFCLRLWPLSDDADVHLLAARAAWMTRDFGAAEAHLHECLRIQHGATEATQLEFLLLRAKSGEEEEVMPALFGYIDNEHPDTPLILKTLAQAFMHRLRYGHAEMVLRRWIKEQPDNPVPYHWHGWVLERLDHHLEAFDDYEKALELDPDLDPVRLRVAEMLLEDKKPVQALPHLERLRNQFPDRADILSRLGHCYFLQGKNDEAQLLLEQAEKGVPDDSTLLIDLAKLAMNDDRRPETERLADAERRLRHAIEVDPSDTEALWNLQGCLMQQDRKQEAAAVLAEHDRQKVLVDRANKLLKDEAEHPSRDPAAALEIGNLLMHKGQERLAVYWLEQALARDPRYAPAHQALAEFFEKKGDKERAAAHRQQLTPTSKGPDKLTAASAPGR